jgi:starch-binding outer membrane protein, SusD/RagB family
MERKFLIVIGVVILGIALSCKKSEDVQTPPPNFPSIPDIPNDSIKHPRTTLRDLELGYIRQVYISLHAITGSNQENSPGDIYQDQSFCTDEAVLPTRGGDWYEAGRFQSLFEHTWTPETPDFNTIWNFSYNMINQSNGSINFIQKHYRGVNTTADSAIGELKVLRSLGFYYLIDFFGNVPIQTYYDSTYAAPDIGNNSDFALGRAELFDTIVNTIDINIKYLRGGFNDSTFGYLNTWTAYALLAKMYINSEAWTGISKYDECIAACDHIINSGLFSISPDYFSNFKQDNKNSKENIFVVNYSQNSGEPYEGFYLMSLHYNSNLKYGTVSAAWNGFCALPDHYHSFDSSDVRRNGWSAGAQFESDGITPLVMIRLPYQGWPLNFTPDFIDVSWNIPPYSPGPLHGDTLNYKNCLENNGARLVKYEIAAGLSNTSLGVPLALFRYADILMLKAEALMRKNGGLATQQAVALVNQIRTRAGVPDYTTSTLTMDELLAERGREFYYEGVRRQDLIRFGKFIKGTWGRNFSGSYQDQWYDRSGEMGDHSVFPIPQKQMISNPLLHQNPGY